MLSGGIAALNHRLNKDDALRATLLSLQRGLPSGSPYSYAIQPDLQADVGASGSSPALRLSRMLPGGHHLYVAGG